MKDYNFVDSSGYPALPESFQEQKLFKRFKDKILFPIKYNGTHNIKMPNGLMIYGPPNNGKLNLAMQFAQMTGFPYIIIGRHDILDGESNSTCQGFLALLKAAQEISPSIIIIQNIETIVPGRELTKNSSMYVDVMTNLSLMKDCGKSQVYIFATTSRPNDVDYQIGTYGYLDELFFTPYPDDKKRREIIEKCLCCDSNDSSDVLEQIVKQTEDYTIGDIQALINEMNLEAALTEKKLDNKMMELVFENFRTPLSGMFRAKLEQVHKALESNASSQRNSNIGFV